MCFKYVDSCDQAHDKPNDQGLIQIETARQCSPLRRKFMECYIINPALSLLMKHLVIGQRQKALNFSAFHWSPHGSLLSIGQYFVTTRVVHLPKRTEKSLNTESDQRASNHQLCSYAQPAQPAPIRTRLCGPCIAAIAGYIHKIHSI